MQMTYQQYIDNPLGRRNAVFHQRDLYKGLYTEKFDKLLLREAGNIEYIMYVDKTHDIYVIHIKIPSETVKNFYYDAVIMFYTDDGAVHSSSTLQQYYVKFFSNDPAFVFTYLRVFLKNDLFIEDLKPKTSSIALKQDPKHTNPYEIPGYSKILYFAYLFMKNRNLFQKHMWSGAQKYSKKALVDSIEHTDKKIAERQDLAREQEAYEARVKRDSKRESHKHNENPPMITNIINKVVKRAPVVKTTKTAKRSKTVKRK